MAELRPELLASDVADTPAWLHRVVDAHEDIDPLALKARRVLFIGMGSSRYAALNAAAYLRSLGRDAHAEHASTGSPQRSATEQRRRIAAHQLKSNALRSLARHAQRASEFSRQIRSAVKSGRSGTLLSFQSA